MAISCAVLLLVLQAPVLGIDGTRFTLDGKPEFLLGISYYGALAIKDEAIVADDLRIMKEHGFNWLRVWATWNGHGLNVSAIDPKGQPREPYFSRLLRLCKLAGERGLVVDVTLVRGDNGEYPANLAEHRAVLSALTRALVPYRNVYFDISNERNIGDARRAPMEEVRALIDEVKRIDPARLCTASTGGDISDEDVREYLAESGVDFLAIHRDRGTDSPGRTAGETARMLKVMEGLRRAPIHYNEPFRRDYGAWQPAAEDFMTDLEQARASSAAGWCFHNGSVRDPARPDARPRRSFDLRPSEPRLFDQFDETERAFLDRLKRAY